MSYHSDRGRVWKRMYEKKTSYHNGRGRGQKKGKVEKFSYHKIYNEVENEVYGKKGLGK